MGFIQMLMGYRMAANTPADALRQAQCDSRAQICGGVLANSRNQSPDLHFLLKAH